LLWAIVLVPMLGGALAFAVPSGRARPWVVPAVGVTHLALVIAALWIRPSGGTWLRLDPLDTLVLGQVSGVYLLASLYAPGYLRLRAQRDNRVFCGVITLFLGTLSLGILARHLGLMWVGVETATLTAAPLLYFNQNRGSIEATWRYLLVGSVGIAMALLGSFFLAYAALYARLDTSLFFDDLAAQATHLSKPWLHAAIILLFVGYGTKMGLAPMHTWKPDAYGEAPGLVGTLLAGGMTSCAFLAILRVVRLAALAGDLAFVREILLVLGLLSMATAGVFMVRQNDFKRTLAWSSIEHMGILVLGIGLGGPGVFGALFHMVNNGFTKGVLFLSAGNIHRAFGSKLVSQVSGAIVRTPASGTLLLLGFFAVTGAPPFGPFFSELTILDAALGQGHPWIAAMFLLCLLVVFVGMGTTLLQVVQGQPPAGAPTPPYRDDTSTLLPIFGFLAVSLLLGVYLPGPLSRQLDVAAAYVEGR
jgi:hydrogenase-4 component F